MGDPHPLPLGWDTATSSPKPSPGGHKSHPFGGLELRCLWGYHGWCLLGWGGSSHVPPKAEPLLPQHGERLSQPCPLEESPSLRSALVKTILCLPMPLKGQFIKL